MSINKAKREAVYRKYDGHCAYCGCELEYKDMQVDHLVPLKLEPAVVTGSFPGIDSIDDFNNLMPSCRKCNHYKRAHSLETFRRYIEEIPRKLSTNYIYEVGRKYWLIVEWNHPVEFYFERVERRTHKPVKEK